MHYQLNFTSTNDAKISTVQLDVISMQAQREREALESDGLSQFFWNVIGGAMVSAMLSGVVYLLVGMIGKYAYATDKYWDLIYLKWYFIVILAIYLIMPTMLANTIGFIFGNKSSASGTKPRL